MSLNLTLIRIDPVARTIVKMQKLIGRNATPEIRKILRAERSQQIGWHKLLEIGGIPLIAAGKLSVDEAVAKWQLPGCEEHAGIGLLFGQGAGGGMTNCPASLDWVEKRIQWLNGEDLLGLQERAEALVSALPDEITTALRRAIDAGPLRAAATSLWLPVADREHFETMIRLGLGDEQSDGQRLTRLGGAVRELLRA